MAVTRNNQSSVADTFAATTITAPIDLDAGVDFVLGCLSGDFFGAAADASAEWDGNAMAEIAGAFASDDLAKVFGYVAPAVDASYDLVFDGSDAGSPSMAGIAIGFTGVDQTTPLVLGANVTAGSGNISQAVTTEDGDYVIGVIFSTDFNNVSGGDLLINSNSSHPIAILAKAAVGASTTLTGNLTGAWVGTFVVIKAAPGGVEVSLEVVSGGSTIPTITKESRALLEAVSGAATVPTMSVDIMAMLEAVSAGATVPGLTKESRALLEAVAGSATLPTMDVDQPQLVALGVVSGAGSVVALTKETRAFLPVVSATGDPGSSGSLGVLHELAPVTAGATMQTLTPVLPGIDVALGVVSAGGTVVGLSIEPRAYLVAVGAGASMQTMGIERRAFLEAIAGAATLPAMSAGGELSASLDPIGAGAVLPDLVVEPRALLEAVTASASVQAITSETRAFLEVIAAGASGQSLDVEGAALLEAIAAGATVTTMTVRVFVMPSPRNTLPAPRDPLILP